jgi:hypothetical protein
MFLSQCRVHAETAAIGVGCQIRHDGRQRWRRLPAQTGGASLPPLAAKIVRPQQNDPARKIATVFMGLRGMGLRAAVVPELGRQVAQEKQLREWLAGGVRLQEPRVHTVGTTTSRPTRGLFGALAR